MCLLSRACYASCALQCRCAACIRPPGRVPTVACCNTLSPAQLLGVHSVHQ
jgi:hypothetical protein